MSIFCLCGAFGIIFLCQTADQTSKLVKYGEMVDECKLCRGTSSTDAREVDSGTVRGNRVLCWCFHAAGLVRRSQQPSS
jgi:hypothetical protein